MAETSTAIAKPKGKAISLPKDREARKAIAAMNEPLRKLYDGLVVKLNRLAESGIWHSWNIGKTIEKATEDTRKETYGEEAAAKLSQALGIPTPRLYAMRSFAIGFTKEQLEKLLARETRFGGRISYSHLQEVAREKGSNRSKMLTYYFGADPTPTYMDLRAWAQEQFNDGSPRGNNSVGVLPRSPASGLRTMDNSIDSFMRIHDLLGKAVFDRFSEDGEKYATEDMLERLLTTEQKLESVKRKCEEDIRRTGNAVRELTQQLQSKNNEAAEAAGPRRLTKKKKVAKRGAAKGIATTKKKVVKKKVVKKKAATGAAPVKKAVVDRPAQTVDREDDPLFA